MATSSYQNPVPKVIALVLVTLCAAWLAVKLDTSSLAKMDSMSAADYIQRQRGMFHHSLVHHFIIFLIFGGFFLGAVEFLAYVIGFLIPKKSDS
jgi:hypothetical protein